MKLPLPPLFGPVFRAELLTLGRRKRYLAIRSLYAAVLLVLIARQWPPADSIPIESSQTVLSRVARGIFQSFSIAQLYLVMAITPALVGATIARDREMHRLEDLLATPLGSWTIVLDKFLARLTAIAAQVLAGVPVLALAMLMGGISPWAIAASSAFTLSVVLAIGGASMLASVWAARARDALVRSYLYLAALVAFPPFGAELAYELADDRPMAGWWLVNLGNRLSRFSNVLPYRRLTEILREGGRSDPIFEGLAYSALYALFGLACVLLAVLQLGAAYRRSIAQFDKRKSGRLRWRYWRPPVWDRGMLWKEVHVERDSSLGWRGRIIAIAIMAVAAGSVAWTFYAFVDAPHATVYSTLAGRVATSAWLIGLTAMVVVGMRAASCITRERERDSWHLLMSTPLEPREVLTAKGAGSWFEGAVLFAMTPLVWAPVVIVHPTQLLGLATFSVGLLAICAAAIELGLLLSLVCRNTAQAVVAFATLFIIVPGTVDLIASANLGSPSMSPVRFLILAAESSASADPRQFLFDRSQSLFPLAAGALIYAAMAIAMRRASVLLFDAREERDASRLRTREDRAPRARLAVAGHQTIHESRGQSIEQAQ